MQLDTLPTLDSEPPPQNLPMISTHHGGVEPFDERFRRAKLRGSLFGDAGDELRIGRYKVLERVGAGAMGSVYTALDEELERKIAVKLLRANDETSARRMYIEAKALAKLAHPNVVTVHEVSQHDGQVFVAMEYVEGQTLSEWLATGPTGPQVLHIFAQAARGLQAAHDADIVHRDFKPDNVLVGRDGRVRVLDFGLARATGEALTGLVDDPDAVVALDRATLTRTGMLAGTPGYMAPEQFLGGRVDARADQFAFCAALHEALWGERPYSGDNLGELATAVLGGDRTLFRSGPGRSKPITKFSKQRLRGLQTVIERGLSTQVSRRFDDMTQIALLLEQPAAGRSVFKTVAIAISGVFVLGGLTCKMLVLESADDPGTAQSGQYLEAQGYKEAAETFLENTRIERSAVVLKAVELEPAAPTQGPSCAAGSYADNGDCVDLGWDPELVQCNASGCEIPKWLLTAMLTHRDASRRQARLVPTLRNGKTVGYKVFGVRANSLPQRLGLESGDLLLNINGHALTTIEAIPQGLKAGLDAGRIELNFRRKGEVMSVVVRPTDAPAPAKRVLGPVSPLASE